MQNEDGTFCFEAVRGEPGRRGQSLRYTAMVFIGLMRAESAGYRHQLDTHAIRAVFHHHRQRSKQSVGDLGLALWVDSLAGERSNVEIMKGLERTLDTSGGLAELEGQQVGWLLTGLALQEALGQGRAGFLRKKVTDFLVQHNQSKSGLFYHVGASRIRRRFPNFATQIYAVLALATVARLGLDGRALGAATRAADRLVCLQLEDGGWPWLFDASRGQILERYRIYSVHQHAMAPMGFLELVQAGGDPGFIDALVRGVSWLGSRNELAIDMVDEVEGLIYRSIRRRQPWNKVWRAANTALAIAGLPSDRGVGRALELNPTCRPYELGWLLEAWCGRESLARR
jgi:hypothetical protein